MQNLTARGIRLANTFRKLGIPVIESYPGAAQDILGIPRKRADVNLLKVALGQFGIRGKFRKQAVTHDELDAITSAMVGLFFMNGNFEALGNEDEEYLIIPEVSSDRNLWGSRKVIGLSGPIAAGKTTAGDTIASLGFAYGRYSLVLKQLLEDRGIPISRDSLQAIGEEVYEQQGQRWLARRLLAMLPQNANLVIDGLRHPEDHAFLVETFGPDFTHLHIAAPLADRRLRYITEGLSGEEFERAISHSVEGNVEKLSSLADTTIMNYDSKQSFEEELIKRFGETL
jgi:dephospho-CoA kinase